MGLSAVSDAPVGTVVLYRIHLYHNCPLVLSCGESSPRQTSYSLPHLSRNKYCGGETEEPEFGEDEGRD